MTDTEQILRVYTALAANPEWKRILEDAIALEGKKEAYQVEGYSGQGFTGTEIQTDQQTLNKMVASELLSSSSSDSATHYRVADPALVREIIKHVAVIEEVMPAPRAKKTNLKRWHVRPFEKGFRLLTKPAGAKHGDIPILTAQESAPSVCDVK